LQKEASQASDTIFTLQSHNALLSDYFTQVVLTKTQIVVDLQRELVLTEQQKPILTDSVNQLQIQVAALHKQNATLEQDLERSRAYTLDSEETNC
jgi:hypothetical protein